MTKFNPISDRVLVRRADPETKTRGGLFIPDAAREKPQRATVIAVGPGLVTDAGVRVEPRVKTGDTVIVSKWEGNEIRIDDVDHLVVRESEILGVEET
jgi:chaperonin GroES